MKLTIIMPTGLASIRLRDHFKLYGDRSYLHSAVTSVARILSRVSGSAVYLSLMKFTKPDCSHVTKINK